MSSVIFTMLGLSGTGKTHACKALFRMMEDDNLEHGVYLTADGRTPAEKLRHKTAIRNYAPETRTQFTRAGTEGIWDLPLAVCVSYKTGLPSYPVLKTPICDYAGGIVQTVASGIRDDEDYERKQNAQRLMGSILSSDVLMLLADANLLSEQEGPGDPVDRIKESLSADINDIFMSYVETENGEFLSRRRTVIVMLTKCDSNLIPEEMAAENFRGLMARAATVFRPIWRVCQKNDWPFAIIPTSACGNEHSYTVRKDFGRYESTVDPSRGMEPYGFDLAFLYGLMSELQYRADNRTDKNAETRNLSDLTRRQRKAAEKLGQREQEERWRLYRETSNYLQNHLANLLNAPHGGYVIDERSHPFFTDEEEEPPRRGGFTGLFHGIFG